MSNAANFTARLDVGDGHSVDLHPNYTIARCKTELSALTGPARAAVAKTILARSLGSVVTTNDPGAADAIRALPVQHFVEAVADYGYTLTHFATPIVLGWMGGYASGGKEIVSAELSMESWMC